MLLRKALNKIFITSLTVLILLVVYLIPVEKNEDLPTNLEIEYMTGLGNSYVYLLNKENQLVQTKVLLDESDIVKQVEKIIDSLKDRESNSFHTLRGMMNPTLTVKNVELKDKVVTVDLSNDFLDTSDNLMLKQIEALTYSILSLENISGLQIKIEGVELSKVLPSLSNLPKVLTKDIGINKVYSFMEPKDIAKVNLYYVAKLGSSNYYVPVTKYVNDTKDKIKIIIDELASNYIYEPNLMSFLNSNAKLLDYKEQENIMTLNFNNAIFDSNSKVEEEVKYTLAYSIFDNYDVNQVLLQVDGKNIDTIGLNDVK